MPLLAGSAFLKALGWALLNSVWQMGILWLAYKLLTGGYKKLSATARHSVSLGLLITGTVWFLSGLSWKYYSLSEKGDAYNSSLSIANSGYAQEFYSAQEFLDVYMPYWSIIYLASIAILFFKFCLYVHQAGTLQTKGISKMPAAWRLHVEKISQQLGITRSVTALLSSRIDTPQVIGYLKPVILVPLACINNLTTEQLETVLLHELVHIKRNDYLINLFVSTAEILFFFNPFVKRLVSSIRKEREYSCDDMVIQFQYHPHNYATALLTLEKSRQNQGSLAMAADGGNQRQLLERIQRIVGIKNNGDKLTHISGYLLAFLLLCLIAVINPARVAVDEFTPGIISFAGNGYGEREYLQEGKPVSFHSEPVANTEKAGSKMLAVADKIKQEETEAMFVADEADAIEIAHIASAAEANDFTMPEKKPLMPEYTVAEDMVPAPFVPSYSLSFQLTRDTTQPAKRRESYNERLARESMEKAKLAMNQIDWKKIEKDLHYDKAKLSALRKQLSAELSKVNWE
ncbi:MAG: M56 family metallopeptidase, partial [Gemmatimonadaceae bacterium]|nr:M56 family metallopeptidase [Chitinophagaceae bacterium]